MITDMGGEVRESDKPEAGRSLELLVAVDCLKSSSCRLSLAELLLSLRLPPCGRDRGEWERVGSWIRPIGAL